MGAAGRVALPCRPLQALASCPLLPRRPAVGGVAGRGLGARPQGQEPPQAGGPRVRPTFGERTVFPQALPPLCQRLWDTADIVLGLQGSQPPAGKGAQHSVGQGRGRASWRAVVLLHPAVSPAPHGDFHKGRVLGWMSRNHVVKWNL